MPRPNPPTMPQGRKPPRTTTRLPGKKYPRRKAIAPINPEQRGKSCPTPIGLIRESHSDLMRKTTQRAQELAAPPIQAHRRKGPDHRHRETEHQGHDEQCQGNDRQARHECAPEGRPEPRLSAHGLGCARADAQLQGGEGDRGVRRIYITDLQRVRRNRRRFAPLTERIQVRGLRPRAERGPECGPQHPGVGDWRDCTARGVWDANLYDPRNGYDGASALSYTSP